MKKLKLYTARLMILLILCSSFLGLSPAARADENGKELLTCGGNYRGEDLAFTYSPITSRYTAYTKNNDMMIFIKPAKAPGYQINVVETIDPKLRDKVDFEIKNLSKEVKDIISEKVARNIITVYGAPYDGMMHFEITHGDKLGTFSCVERD